MNKTIIQWKLTWLQIQATKSVHSRPWMNGNVQIGYLWTGPVLPASCLSRRTCVFCPLESGLLFFILLFLSIIGGTPLLMDYGSNHRSSPRRSLTAHPVGSIPLQAIDNQKSQITWVSLPLLIYMILTCLSYSYRVFRWGMVPRYRHVPGAPLQLVGQPL